MRKSYSELRSARWFAGTDRYGYLSRERIKQAGFTDEDFQGKPVVGIFSTWSELNPCHIHFRQRAAEVKRGVWEAGGFPLEVPVMSLGEAFMRPTTMIAAATASCYLLAKRELRISMPRGTRPSSWRSAPIPRQPQQHFAHGSLRLSARPSNAATQ